MDDILEFNDFHLQHSRAGRALLRNASLSFGAMFALGGVAAGFALRSPLLVAIMLLLSLVAVKVARPLTRRQYRYSVRKMYRDGKNPGTLGWHRLTLRDDGIDEESEAGSQFTRYEAVEQVVDGDSALYIYLGAVTAHVVPRRRVRAGDLVQFERELRARVAAGTR